MIFVSLKVPFAKYDLKNVLTKQFLRMQKQPFANLIRCVPVNFAKFLRTLFFTEHLC